MYILILAILNSHMKDQGRVPDADVFLRHTQHTLGRRAAYITMLFINPSVLVKDGRNAGHCSPSHMKVMRQKIRTHAFTYNVKERSRTWNALLRQHASKKSQNSPLISVLTMHQQAMK